MLKILVYNFLQYFCSLSLEQVIHLPFTNLVVSCKKQELLTFREHQGSPPVFGGIHVAHLFNFLSGVFLFCLSSSCVLCTQCCQCLWIVHSCLPLRFSLTFIYSSDLLKMVQSMSSIFCSFSIFIPPATKL
jgi:hypothetical protein